MTDPATTPSARPTWIAELRYILLLALGVFALHTVVGRPFYIPSESMMPGLMTGDRLIVSKYPYGWSYTSPSLPVLPFIRGRLFGQLPRRGDIVILTPPGRERRSEILIKRVIGLPGDLVEMRRGRLWLNGRAVASRDDGLRPVAADGNFTCDGQAVAGRCRLHIVRETLPNGASYDTIDLGRTRLDDTAPYRVPAGHVFVMGDNRDNSADSRVALFAGGLGGAIPVENIAGRAERITFSMSGNASLDPRTWGRAFRPDRAWISLRPAGQR